MWISKPPRDGFHSGLFLSHPKVLSVSARLLRPTPSPPEACLLLPLAPAWPPLCPQQAAVQTTAATEMKPFLRVALDRGRASLPSFSPSSAWLSPHADFCLAKPPCRLPPAQQHKLGESIPLATQVEDLRTPTCRSRDHGPHLSRMQEKGGGPVWDPTAFSWQYGPGGLSTHWLTMLPR